jgi:hypothetical protein
LDSTSGQPPINSPAFNTGDQANQAPILTFEGKRYDLNGLPDDIKELVRGMQVADAQLRMHEDTLKVLAIGRQAMAMQLNERLKAVNPVGDAEPEG